MTNVLNSIGMSLVLIPAGEFDMGSPAQKIAPPYPGMPTSRTWCDENPLHRVHITRPFLMGSTAVTQGQWDQVMQRCCDQPWLWNTDPTKRSIEGHNVAADYVPWFLAVQFCDMLTHRERSAGRLQGTLRYRLPTEAEWEYACRAGTSTAFSCGEAEDCLGDFAWYAENVAANEVYAREVGLKQPNPWGLFDMHGNVAEWCSDWYNEDYYAESPRADPAGPVDGVCRVLRGGSCYSVAHFCRSANRSLQLPDIRPDCSGSGFRVVCEIA